MGTLRQDIIALLSENSMDLQQLAQSLGVHEKEIRDHLDHIAKTVAGQGSRFRVRPAVCRNCGFTFKERRKLAPPGRCPRCKQSRIEGPWYEVGR